MALPRYIPKVGELVQIRRDIGFEYTPGLTKPAFGWSPYMDVHRGRIVAVTGLGWLRALPHEPPNRVFIDADSTFYWGTDMIEPLMYTAPVQGPGV
jgi:hypothetical protein